MKLKKSGGHEFFYIERGTSGGGLAEVLNLNGQHQWRGTCDQVSQGM